MENDLFAKLLDDRSDLSANEWRSVKAALENDPDLADRLYELLLTDELLSQKFSPDRRDFLAAVASRIDSDQGHVIRLEDVKALHRRKSEAERQPFWHARRTVVAAALLFLTSGLVALWLNSKPSQRLTQHDIRRRRILVEQLRELKLERAAIQLPRPKPAPPQPGTTPEVTTQTVAQSDAEEAAEAARFIEARQRFMMRQLKTFPTRRALADVVDHETDAEDVETQVAAAVGPVEVGRVLLAEDGEGAGQIIRQAEEGSTHHRLSQGLTLLSGDRIETPHGKDKPCASVHLKGGATLDLSQSTTIELLGRDNLRLHSGRIYAHIDVPIPDGSYQEGEPPFSLQTEAGRFLTHEVQAEIYVSQNEVLRKDLCARVDKGKVHLVNRKGHAVGHRGQELRAQAGVRPSRREGFSRPIWRGCERHRADLPFGSGSPIILSTYTPLQHSGMHYALAMALRGEIDLRGLQTTLGEPGGTEARLRYFKELADTTRKLQPLAPRRIPPATLGVMQALEAPRSRLATQTRPARSDAVLQILAAVRNATPRKPLLVLCHGAMTDVACAWLIDPRIANRIIVAGEKNRGRDTWSAWNWDPWAGEIVYRHFRCLLLYHDGLNTDRALLEQVTDPKWISLADNRTGQHHKFSLLYHVSNPDARLEVRRIRLTGTRNDKPVFEEHPNGNIWEIQSRAKRDELLAEFRRIFLTTEH